MEYLKLLNNLSNLEKTYDCLDEIIKQHYKFCTFEEIPIVTRLGREKPFVDYFMQEGLNEFFLNVAVFYVNNINLYAKKIMSENDYKNLSVFITYPNTTPEDFEVTGFYIPNICLTSKAYSFKFLENKILEFDDAVWLYDSLNSLNLQASFNIRYSVLEEFGEKLVRIYLLPK